jgi:N-acetylmuramoyl-L-alanine amidase
VGLEIRHNFAFASHLACFFLAGCLLFAGLARPQAPAQQQQGATPPPASTPPPAAQTSSVAQTPPAAQIPPAHPTFTVVLDPGHGGTDDGARGSTGAVEKDLTLALARATRIQLQQQGVRVILTRDTDVNPSFDDRAAIANAPRLAILISFHVSSTGQVGTARAYSYLFSTNAPAADAPSTEPAVQSPGKLASRLIPWETAQQAYGDTSHRLAEFIQTELVQKFPGSPASSTAFPIRDLRSIAGPAVSVELSSVSVKDAHALDPMIASLAESVARAVTEFRPSYDTGMR